MSKKSVRSLSVNGYEANILLFAFDRMFLTNNKGLITVGFPNYKDEDLQNLRDKLFKAHKHPEEK